MGTRSSKRGRFLSVVYQTLETVKGAPAFEDWVAQQPEGTPWDLYGRQYYNYRLYSRNLKTGDEKTIVDMSENFVWTADPHKSWGQYIVYQVGRSVYVYDMETQAVKELFTYDQDWKNYNYMILDGHVIATLAVLGQLTLLMNQWSNWTPAVEMQLQLLRNMSAMTTLLDYLPIRLARLKSITSAKKTFTGATMMEHSVNLEC